MTSHATEPSYFQTKDHQVTVLPTSNSTLAAMERDLEAARDRVWVETFIVRDDRLGNRLAELLRHASARGADTKLIYAPLGSRQTPPRFFSRLRKSEVEVRAYRPWHLPLRGSARWPRDHARVVCIDDAAYLGGFAFGDDWLPRSEGGSGWHDVCCRIEGPIARELVRTFELRWRDANGSARPVDINCSDFPDLALMADAPARKEGIYRVHRERIQRARSRIWIENSYFFPPRRLSDDLQDAARRGVDVQIIVPAGSDVPIVAAAARGEYAKWLQAGFKIFEYEPTMCHSKFAVIDDDWATAGSFNLNPASLMSSNECNLFLFDRPLVAAFAALFELDRKHCQQIGSEQLRERTIRESARSRSLSIGFRTVEGLAWTTLGLIRNV